MHVRIGLIGLKLIKEGGKAIDIVSDSGCLAYMEHLAHKLVTLITAKAIVEHFAKIRPG